MYNDNLNEHEIVELLEILDGSAEATYSAVVLKAWLTIPVNYDTMSVYYKDQNPYDLDSETVWEEFWDVLEEWVPQGLRQQLIDLGVYDSE